MRRNTSRKTKAVKAKRGRKTKAVHAERLRKRQPPVGAKSADATDGLVAASAQALGINVEPAWHDTVKFNLQLILRLAGLVDEFSLPDDTEPAPVFHA
jgi:hypothetical protein